MILNYTHAIAGANALTYQALDTPCKHTTYAVGKSAPLLAVVAAGTLQRTVDATEPARHHRVAESCRSSRNTAAAVDTAHFVLLFMRRSTLRGCSEAHALGTVDMPALAVPLHEQAHPLLPDGP